MKKLRFLIGLTALFTSLFAFNSCKKSYNCCYAGDCEVVKESDFTSSAEFKSYIKYLENSGYTCH
ncbi:MAG: hypothetical protein IPP77_07225 [Bacteroidetes bacterium]|nr:hypothetical protein [Bacteroidota bacterium]